MEKLFEWAQEADCPLCIYATGLLGGAMENQDIAGNYREENSQLVSERPRPAFDACRPGGGAGVSRMEDTLSDRRRDSLKACCGHSMAVFSV